MGDVADIQVGYLEPQYVDQLRNRLGVGVDLTKFTDLPSIVANAAKLMANGTLEHILESQVYKAAPQTPGQVLANQLIAYGRLPFLPPGANILITDVGGIIGMATGASKLSVTLAVVNIGDQPLELAEEPVVPHGFLASQPAVMAGTTKWDPPHRPGGDEGPLRSWITSPVQAGLPAGWASVGVWRFNRPSISAYGAAGALRLTYHDAKIDVLIGGETPFRSLFTPNLKNSFSAALNVAGTISAQSFFDNHVTGKDFGGLLQATADTGTASFSLVAGCESQTDDHHFVVAIVEAKAKKVS